MPLSSHFLLRFAAKAARCLSLALLPALASEAHAISAPHRKQHVVSTAQPRGSHASTPRPYLVALGSLPLRFARPAPERSAEPPAPPVAKTVEPARADASVTPPSDLVTPPDLPESQPALEAPIVTPEPLAHPPLPILPDDTRREIRPEDVLPFFRYPNSAPSADGVLVPFDPLQPQSAQLPPSSATYEQK